MAEYHCNGQTSAFFDVNKGIQADVKMGEITYKHLKNSLDHYLY